MHEKAKEVGGSKAAERG